MVAGIFDDTMLELRQCQGIEIIREKFCVAGRGFYQEEGKEAICMTAGDDINIPAGVKHWHGAADSWFSHLAISVSGEDTHTEWCEAVDEETYRKAVK